MRFLRNYAIASLLGMVCVALAVLFTYRQILIRSVAVIAEKSSVSVARNALQPISGHVVAYLEQTAAAADARSVAIPPPLADSIANLMRDSRVTKVKIYNRAGRVLFSTESSQIGKDQFDNPGVSAAISGNVSVKLIYRDSFNAFDKTTEDENLVQTYFPVRRQPTDAVAGVFEIYWDVNALVLEAERSELQMVAATTLILIILYGALLLLVHRSHALLIRQDKEIQKKNALLEHVLHESVRIGERRRKRVATNLHEDLAQTLSAVKLAAETSLDNIPEESRSAISSIVADLQKAITQVRDIAANLRPQILDELGLGRALEALCRDFEQANPDVHVVLQDMAKEANIPAPLAIGVYRIVESALMAIGNHPDAMTVVVSLERSGRELLLSVQDDEQVLATAIADGDGEGLREPAYLAVQAQAISSGGHLSIARTHSGDPFLRVSWRI